jgi:hypothetical protein
MLRIKQYERVLFSYKMTLRSKKDYKQAATTILSVGVASTGVDREEVCLAFLFLLLLTFLVPSFGFI